MQKKKKDYVHMAVFCDICFFVCLLEMVGEHTGRSGGWLFGILLSCFFYGVFGMVLWLVGLVVLIDERPKCIDLYVLYDAQRSLYEE
jgi:hypothetical protein